MAFKEILSLDADTTISLGGVDKKTGKPNAKTVEGYFIGTKLIVSKKAKDGFSRLHILQTAKGNLGVWGKTNLDQKMLTVTPGVMIRVTQSGKQNTPNGEMYLFKVEHDNDNSIEVSLAPKHQPVVAEETTEVEAGTADNKDDYYEESDVDLDDSSDEIPYTPPVAPRKPVAAPDAERAARVQALLKSRTSNRLS